MDISPKNHSDIGLINQLNANYMYGAPPCEDTSMNLNLFPSINHFYSSSFAPHAVDAKKKHPKPIKNEHGKEPWHVRGLQPHHLIIDST
jgi:hypothetical protein